MECQSQVCQMRRISRVVLVVEDCHCQVKCICRQKVKVDSFPCLKHFV